MTALRLTAIAAATLAALGTPVPGPQEPMVEFSGPPGSGEPFLSAGRNGGAILSWLEPADGKRWTLRVAAREGGRWSPPETVRVQDRFFVNWADFPSVIETADGKWTVHWLEKTAARSYAYHIRTSISGDRGRTWSAPVTPHRDTSSTEHGFVAMLPRPAGGADLVWLDGRQTADPGQRGPMALATGSLDRNGRVVSEAVLDTRTCDCCQTALARTSEGLIAVYRDRDDAEIRDIAVIRQVNGKWTAPTKVANDGWVYRACPVNGPAIAAQGKEVLVAWFTGADSTPRVKLARSSDAGATFAPPIQVDDGTPLGRVDVERLPDGSALVTWLEIVGDKAEWRVKHIGPDGRVVSRWMVASVPRTREAGFARTTLVGGDLLMAWTAPGPEGGVRVSRARLGTSAMP